MAEEKEKLEQKISLEEAKERLGSFADIKLKIHVEVGRTTKYFFDILKMKEGDVIKLDKSLEDYIDLYINGKRFAIGELIVVNDKYGIRIVDLA